MKKTIYIFFLFILSSGMLFALTSNNNKNDDPQYRDKVEMSRIGGTTRAAGINTVNEIMLEAYNLRDLVTVQVQNYRGVVLVEIIGSRGARRSYFQVFDNGFNAIPIGTLRPGTYTLRITFDSEVYAGTFNKKQHGR